MASRISESTDKRPFEEGPSAAVVSSTRSAASKLAGVLGIAGIAVSSAGAAAAKPRTVEERSTAATIQLAQAPQNQSAYREVRDAITGTTGNQWVKMSFPDGTERLVSVDSLQTIAREVVPTESVSPPIRPERVLKMAKSARDGSNACTTQCPEGIVAGVDVTIENPSGNPTPSQVYITSELQAGDYVNPADLGRTYSDNIEALRGSDPATNFTGARGEHYLAAEVSSWSGDDGTASIAWRNFAEPDEIVPGQFQPRGGTRITTFRELPVHPAIWTGDNGLRDPSTDVCSTTEEEIRGMVPYYPRLGSAMPQIRDVDTWPGPVRATFPDPAIITYHVDGLTDYRGPGQWEAVLNCTDPRIASLTNVHCDQSDATTGTFVVENNELPGFWGSECDIMFQNTELGIIEEPFNGGIQFRQ